jgi:phosphatidate phosphatase LPIN
MTYGNGLYSSRCSEVVLRKPEAFKMACLRDIKRLFSDRNPFYAGFGNRLTDGLSYRHVEIPSSRIFTIDSYGNVKLELLELAGYSSTYIAMANLVDETFPPVNRSSQPAFNDFNYWRPALPNIELPDLTPQPVSPALSARSDSSRMSVFRVGALAGALSKRSSRAQLQNTTSGGDGNRSPLSTSPRSISPSPLHTVFDPSSDDDGGQSRNQSGSQAAKRYRADSMPGSYDDESQLEALRNSVEFGQAESMRRQGSRDSEDGNEDYGSEGDDEDDETRENTLDDDDLPDIDFGSVPVSYTPATSTIIRANVQCSTCDDPAARTCNDQAAHYRLSSCNYLSQNEVIEHVFIAFDQALNAAQRLNMLS